MGIKNEVARQGTFSRLGAFRYVWFWCGYWPIDHRLPCRPLTNPEPLEPLLPLVSTLTNSTSAGPGSALSYPISNPSELGILA